MIETLLESQMYSKNGKPCSCRVCKTCLLGFEHMFLNAWPFEPSCAVFFSWAIWVGGTMTGQACSHNYTITGKGDHHIVCGSLQVSPQVFQREQERDKWSALIYCDLVLRFSSLGELLGSLWIKEFEKLFPNIPYPMLRQKQGSCVCRGKCCPSHQGSWYQACLLSFRCI